MIRGALATMGQAALAMRDAVDHPRDGPGRQPHVRNFFAEEQPGGLVLHEPQWALEGDRLESPVEQPTRYYLVVNLRTSKELGLSMPQSLLLRADEVIQ